MQFDGWRSRHTQVLLKIVQTVGVSPASRRTDSRVTVQFPDGKGIYDLTLAIYVGIKQLDEVKVDGNSEGISRDADVQHVNLYLRGSWGLLDIQSFCVRTTQFTLSPSLLPL